MAAAQSSATHLSDAKLIKGIGPFPHTERGVPSSIYAHPKEPRVIYPSGRSVVVRHLEDPSECFVYYGHNNPVTVAKFSPSGYWVASADDTGKVRVWSWDNPEHTLKVEVAAFAGRIIDLDWDPESKRIVVVGDGKQLSAKCFMWDTGNSVGEMIGHAKRITTVAYKPSRPFRIMTGGEDFKTCWYTGPPFKIDHTNADHTKEVWCVRFSPDGTKLASVGADRRIVFYDAKEGTKSAEVVEGATEGAHSAAVVHCCWSPDSTQLATCSLDKTVKVWDVATGACAATFTFGGGGGGPGLLGDMQCAVVWSGPHLVALNLAGELNYLDLASPNAPARTVVAHRGPCGALAAVPEGQADGTTDFVTGGDDGRALVWQGSGVAVAVTGTDPTARTTHAGKVVGVAAFPGGLVASAGFDDKLRLSGGAGGGCELALDGQPAQLAAAPLADLLAVGLASGHCLFVQPSAGAVALGDPMPLPGVPQALALSPDGGELACAVGSAIHIYAVAAGAITAVKVLEGHRGAVGCLAYSPDGAYLAAGDANREVKVWDRSSWETKVSGKWVFHTSGVTSVAWAPNSAFVASGSFDQSIFLWNLAKPMKKQEIKFAHKAGVSALAYLTDSTLASTGHDGCVNLWNATPPE